MEQREEIGARGRELLRHSIQLHTNSAGLAPMRIRILLAVMQRLQPAEQCALLSEEFEPCRGRYRVRGRVRVRVEEANGLLTCFTAAWCPRHMPQDVLDFKLLCLVDMHEAVESCTLMEAQVLPHCLCILAHMIPHVLSGIRSVAKAWAHSKSLKIRGR